MNVLALSAGLVFAWPPSPVAPWVAATAGSVGGALPPALLSGAPLAVTAVVLVAGLEVGCRGLGFWPQHTCPKLLHGPLAALLPVLVVAGWPLIGQTWAMLQASLPEDTAVAAPAVLAAPPAPVAVVCSPGGPPGEVAGWSGPQVDEAAVIVAVGREMGVPHRGQVIAVATGMQESSLRNLPGGDRDSLGTFQQRPSQGWGSREQIADPRYAARKFYDGLLALPGWHEMPLTDAAQRVQRSGHPHAYARHEAAAVAVVDAVDLTCNPA